MVATNLSIYLGSYLTFICVSALTLNLSVLYVLYRGKFLSPSYNSVYILAFANICGNVLMLVIYGFYLGPSCILQDFLFPGGKDNFFTGFISYVMHSQWVEDLFIHDATSFNRLINIVYPRAAFLFSRKMTIMISIFVYFLGFFISWIADYYLPCCRIYAYYGSYSYGFLDTDYNVANIFIDTPINFIASAIAVINYTIIYIFVHISNRKIIHVIDKSVQKTRRNQEIKYVFQFALCTGCCIGTWVSTRVFIFAEVPKGPLYLITSTFYVFHAAANSIVFLTFNKDVRQQFKHHILQRNPEKSTSMTVVHSVTAVHTQPKVT